MRRAKIVWLALGVLGLLSLAAHADEARTYPVGVREVQWIEPKDSRPMWMALFYPAVVDENTGKAFTVRYDRPVLDPAAVADQIVSSTRTEFGVAPTDVQCPKDVHYDRNATFTCTAKLENQTLNYVLTQTDGLGAVSVAHGRVLKMAELTAQVGGELSKGAGVPVVAECGTPGQTLIVNEPDTRIECRAWATANPGRVIPIPIKVDRSGTAYPADPVQ